FLLSLCSSSFIPRPSGVISSQLAHLEVRALDINLPRYRRGPGDRRPADVSKNFRGAGKRGLLKRLPVRKLAVYRLGCRMAEDFDPCLFLDVAPEAKFRFNIINMHATSFLAQQLDFANREGMAERHDEVREL